MRLDKYLKVSRLIKRRTVANEACDAGRVLINDKVAKASTEVKVGDVIETNFVPNDFGRIAAQTAKQVILQKFVFFVVFLIKFYINSNFFCRFCCKV